MAGRRAGGAATAGRFAGADAERASLSELRNTTACAVDVSGWRLIGAIEFTLRASTVIPAGKSRYLAANVNAFRARAAEVRAYPRFEMPREFRDYEEFLTVADQLIAAAGVLL